MSDAGAFDKAFMPIPEPITLGARASDGRSRPPATRRRDKPQLSCNACRRRKVRCDRLHPCSNCSSRGLSALCTYSKTPSVIERPHGNAHVQDRIDQLENLVVSLMQQTASSPQALALLEKEGHRKSSPSSSGMVTESPVEANTEQISPEVSSSPYDNGSIQIKDSRVSYISSAHWAAVLESIDELRDHLEQDDESRVQFSNIAQVQTKFPSPRLFYSGCPAHITVTSILESIPPRSIVDKLVFRYFNVLDMTSGIPHCGKFLREYEEFWKCPSQTPIMWIGLLYSIMCLSAQFQQSFVDSATTPMGSTGSQSTCQTPDSRTMADTFHETIIQCLILGHYTTGGPYVMETLILYLIVEVFPAQETEIGLRTLVGIIVQIATQMGYHRDAEHFPNISPFVGEMRRRVWAMIAQYDFTISMQLGLARLIKEDQADVVEPRNLFDSDFDEDTVELPPSRPESEVTPSLYTLAKLRIIAVGAKVADVSTQPRPCSYSHVLTLDKQIDEVRNMLPTSMKWDDLASSLSVPSQVLLKRIFLAVCIQRLKIVLHRRFFMVSRRQEEYAYSHLACVSAAMKILEFHRLVNEEVLSDGRLYQDRWRVSPSFTHDFLLATSILCYYLRTYGGTRGQQGGALGGEAASNEFQKIRDLLRASQTIWVRDSYTSKEARKAATALRCVLGPTELEEETGPQGLPGLYASEWVQGYEVVHLDPDTMNEEMSWQRLVEDMSNGMQPWGLNTRQQMSF